MVALIKKRAQDLGDPPGVDMKTYKPTPIAAPATSPPPPNLPPPPAPPIASPNVAEAPEGGNPNAVVHTPSAEVAPPTAIVKMQTELTNLAKAVTSQIGAGAMAAPSGTKNGPVKPGEQPAVSDEAKEAGGRLAFSNFITEHYIRQSDVPAVEYDPDAKVTDVAKKQPTKATRMNVVMDTMSRVGSPDSEFKVDGRWGPRTNAALRNAYALAFALFKMAKDFKLEPPPKAYDESNLQQLKSLIPLHDNELSLTDKIARAKAITPHIQAIRNLFSEVKDRILQKPAYRSYIEGTQAYATYQKNQTPPPQLVQDLDKKFTNMKVLGAGADGKQKSVPITVSDLITPQAFQLWLQTNLPNMQPQDALTQIKKHLDETDVSRGAT